MLQQVGGAGERPTALALPVTLPLQRAFGARSPWRLELWQDTTSDTPPADAEDSVPGAVHFCLTRTGRAACAPVLVPAPVVGAAADFATPRYLRDVRVVRADARPLLLVRWASMFSGDGDQLVTTRLLAYDAARDGFVPAFARTVGRNNNQEVRFLERGPLAGATVVAEPTDDAPYAYWVSVYRPAGLSYRRVLRFRSATRYGDGDRRAVIDAEMAGILRRVGR